MSFHVFYIEYQRQLTATGKGTGFLHFGGEGDLTDAARNENLKAGIDKG